MSRPPHRSRQTVAVLRSLLNAPTSWQHGYELMQATGLKSGTLYPLLMRLADAGLLESEWQAPVPPARAPRHAYRLTADGLRFAEAMASDRTDPRVAPPGAVLA